MSAEPRTWQARDALIPVGELPDDMQREVDLGDQLAAEGWTERALGPVSQRTMFQQNTDHLPDVALREMEHKNPNPEIRVLAAAELRRRRAVAGGASIIVGIEDYRARVPVAIPWVVARLAYLGGVTMIYGPPKCGKSTFAKEIQRSRETGEPLLGAWDVAVGPTLLVTEEGGIAVVYKAGGLSQLEILDRRAAVRARLTFDQLLDLITDWSEDHPGGTGALVFIDTLAIWAEFEDENDSTATTEALGKIAVVAQSANVAIIVIHHSRKSGGEDGAAVRGSSAILATVDIGAELSRVKTGAEDDRHLDLIGRVILPDRYRLSFDRSGMAYRLADREGADLAEIEADLADIPPDGPGLTRSDLQGVWRRDPRKRADQLVNVGRMRTEYVKAGRGWGYRYWSIPAAVRPWTPPLEPSDD